MILTVPENSKKKENHGWVHEKWKKPYFLYSKIAVRLFPFFIHPPVILFFLEKTDSSDIVQWARQAERCLTDHITYAKERSVRRRSILSLIWERSPYNHPRTMTI